MLKVEPGECLIGREDFIIAVAPAQTREIVAHGFGQIAEVAIGFNAQRPVTFGKLRTVRSVDQRHMRKFRHVPAHGLVDLALPSGIGQVVVATNDMRHAHVVIIDHDREVVSRRPVAAHDDKIVELRIGECHVTHHMITHHRLALVG